jgi:hypothetical protein
MLPPPGDPFRSPNWQPGVPLRVPGGTHGPAEIPLRVLTPDIRKAVAMKTGTDSTARLAQSVTDPFARAAIGNMASTPTIASKVAEAAKIATNPAVQEMLNQNQWLMKTGGR